MQPFYVSLLKIFVAQHETLFCEKPLELELKLGFSVIVVIALYACLTVYHCLLVSSTGNDD